MLEALPPVNDARLAVRVTSDAQRQIRGGHPWVYDASITSLNHRGAPGDLAIVFDQKRKFAAIGLYDPDGPIALRIIHVGKPRPIDDHFWAEKVADAAQLRRPLMDVEPGGRPAYRLINGENDALPGFVVDRYADMLVVKVYSPVWFPHLRHLVESLIDETGAAAVVLRLARNVAAGDTFGLADGDVIAGVLAQNPVAFTEGGLSFEADVRAGQKTGHFLDQRANRMRVGELAAGCDVLDLFASTGGFTVHAAAGGATSVHSVDLSAPTLAATKRNLALNAHLPAVAACTTTSEVGDAFEVMSALARAGNTYDLVIIDPPSFAQKRSSVDGALRAYARLTHLALPLVRPGGTLVQASCSSRVSAEAFFSAVLDAADVAGDELIELARTGHDLDHPVTFPEGAYLKAGFWTVR
ncbi:class I SAM-dependent methyltransferase [Candidatus Neomicrothrix sp.]|uniref:class I SAM-dependent methyltransferase n=1 Tax=Candidatus Neomicrothrix sp. TaxID=2719034 RepID=UPI002592383B|nr:class I SAM-dependent methyltransferase [Candidatus Microthrix sp.]HMS49764.1 class I SAM-dependent methyltransferase [Candidatus Microthrix sp.]